MYIKQSPINIIPTYNIKSSTLKTPAPYVEFICQGKDPNKKTSKLVIKVTDMDWFFLIEKKSIKFTFHEVFLALFAVFICDIIMCYGEIERKVPI